VLSILIVNWNTRELLGNCLRSIRSHPPAAPHEVIVVDNASDDGSADMVRNDFPDVRLIASDKNDGYAKGNNIAFSAASGEFLLTLNPDTELQDDSLNVALAAFERSPYSGVLGVKQIGLDGRVQSSVRGFPTFRGILGDATGLGARFGGALDSYRLTHFDYDVEQPAPQPMGTFLMFRRSALAAVGDPRRPFDEGFPLFFNEVDLLYRLKRAGWDCLYVPAAHILHHGGESTKQVRKKAIWESHRSLARYFRKHHGTGINRVGLSFLVAGLWLTAWLRARGYDPGFEQ
jgi:GT2 family glycosyltransferase